MNLLMYSFLTHYIYHNQLLSLIRERSENPERSNIQKQETIMLNRPKFIEFAIIC